MDFLESLCEHQFVYQGVTFVDAKDNLPGTGARGREYFETHFCSRCLKQVHRPIPLDANSYQNILFEATPQRR